MMVNYYRVIQFFHYILLYIILYRLLYYNLHSLPTKGLTSKGTTPHPTATVKCSCCMGELLSLPQMSSNSTLLAENTTHQIRSWTKMASWPRFFLRLRFFIEANSLDFSFGFLTFHVRDAVSLRQFSSTVERRLLLKEKLETYKTEVCLETKRQWNSGN